MYLYTVAILAQSIFAQAVSVQDFAARRSALTARPERCRRLPREPFACGTSSNGQTATASSRVTDWEADLEIGVASLVDVATTRDSTRGAIREEIGGHKTGGKTNAPGQMEHSTTGRDEGRKQMGGQQTRPGTETWKDQEETKEKEAIDKGERKLSKTELDTITQLLGRLGWKGLLKHSRSPRTH